MEPNCKAKKVDMVWSSFKITTRHSSKKVIKRSKEPLQKPKGGQKSTWIKQIAKDLEKVEFKTLVKNNKDGSNTIQVKEHEKMAQNIHIWRLTVDRDAMSL